ncbi:ABC-2 family transporter protein, partial [Sphingomonas sp. 10B4]|nr:ABC-2 family transporter protein [Sphingomonas sp. 10B4]
YGVTQGIFWWALSQHSQFLGFMSQHYLLVFFVTVVCVDNLYMMLFGQSSMELQRRVHNMKLDTHLLLPVHLPFFYVATSISLQHAMLT